MNILKNCKRRQEKNKGKKYKLQRENRGNVVDVTQTIAITILNVSGSNTQLKWDD